MTGDAVIEDIIKILKTGEKINYSGKLTVMRDAAQKRLLEMYKDGKKLPIDLSEKIIFYAGPTFTNGKMVIGPTTSKRMDSFLEFLALNKVLATIGKGERTKEAIETIKKYKMPYFVAPSGCAAYLAQSIVSWKLIAFEDLGPEAIYEIQVANFPMLVAIDTEGNKIFLDADKFNT